MEKVEKGMLVTYIQKTDKKGLCPYHWVERVPPWGGIIIKNAKTGGTFPAERDKILVHWLQVGTVVEYKWLNTTRIGVVYSITYDTIPEDLIISLHDESDLLRAETQTYYLKIFMKCLITIPSHKIHLEAL